MLNVERLIQRDLDRWIDLLGLTSWKITWELTDKPIDRDVPVAVNHYYVRQTGRKEAHIKFDRFHMKSPASIEKAIVHELLHLLDHGIGNDAHKFIERLEVPLRRLRMRVKK